MDFKANFIPEKKDWTDEIMKLPKAVDDQGRQWHYPEEWASANHLVTVRGPNDTYWIRDNGKRYQVSKGNTGKKIAFTRLQSGRDER